MIKPLEEVLKYENKHTLKRFKQFRPDAVDEADLIFDDLKRFLWLVATQLELKKQGQEVPDISFPSSMIIMDDMWHAFILWTDMYTKFCDEYFGQYIHHPTDMPVYYQNHYVDKMPEEEATRIWLEGQVTITMETFGEEITQRWFDYYSKYEASGIH